MGLPRFRLVMYHSSSALRLHRFLQIPHHHIFHLLIRFEKMEVILFLVFRGSFHSPKSHFTEVWMHLDSKITPASHSRFLQLLTPGRENNALLHVLKMYFQVLLCHFSNIFLSSISCISLDLGKKQGGGADMIVFLWGTIFIKVEGFRVRGEEIPRKSHEIGVVWMCFLHLRGTKALSGGYLK